MVILYTVKVPQSSQHSEHELSQVKLFLGAIAGDLTAELPFVLMHPKPNMKRMIKVGYN